MKNKIFGVFVCLLMIMTAFTAIGANNKIENNKPILFNDNTCKEFAPGEIIVKLKKDATFSRFSLMALNEKHQAYALETVFPNAEDTILDNIYLVHVPIGSDIFSIVQEYASYPDVVYAEPNWIGFPCGIPNDVNLSNQWYLHNNGQIVYKNLSGTPDADIDAPEAWDLEIGSSDVVIAIVDSGIDYNHPDLTANIWNNADEIPGNVIDDDQNGYIDDVMGWNFYFNNSDVKDVYGHGTLCAGVVGAVGDNGLWGAGVVWNCKIMPVRVANDSSYFSLKYVAKGIIYAADNGADICSMSFLFTNSSALLMDTIDYAYSKGVFLCAAVGNKNDSTKYYPAAYDNVIAVAMTDWNDNRAVDSSNPRWGSNYGDWVDIAAPGYGIFSTMPTYHVVYNDYYGKNQNFDWVSGTSYATSIVAGVAALLLSKNPSLTQDEIKTLICENADPYNSIDYIGTGRINAYKALKAIKVKAKDIYYAENSLETLTVSIPKSKTINTSLFLQKFFQRFIFFEKILNQYYD